MSTSVIEPGTRLAGRYRLEERISDTGGSSLWKAIDEILARAVAVRTFDPDFPRVHEVVTSARAASRLTDPRLTQVFDADDSGESAYVVSEWVVGETLEQMLGKAPLEPGRAATLLYEAAEAMAAAHAAGLAHLCLTPRDLVWTTGGTVKLLGIATDAVLCDRYADDPAGEDVRGLGRMLYAALTAHWPGDDEGSDLPSAPGTGGVPHAPRQVQAGISHAVDAIVCRCLGLGGAEALTTPAEVAKALRGVPRTPLPLFAGLGSAPPPPHTAAPRPAPAPAPKRPATHHAGAPTHHAGAPSQQHQPPVSQPTTRIPEPRTRTRRNTAPPPVSSAHGTTGVPRRPANRALLGVAAAALTVIVGLGAWALVDNGSKEKPNGARVTDQGKTSAPPKPTAVRLNVQAVTGFEKPIGGHHDEAVNRNTNLVIDGKPGTAWETQSYADPSFGNYSKGIGVLLDMGRPVKVSSVKIITPQVGGILQIKIGNSQSGADLKSVGRQQGNGGELTVPVSPQVSGQYVLVWFTKLPASLKGKLGEVAVYGSPS
ncbi:AMP-binding protein [Actinomadura graeca]|uniref:AMP-binding protein n=1 Tax=Actinomadura graeca TaxID=2750812 RepID=A0ABX8QW29_9ACTN|nr:protein kinase family protein [Actinomadura graeca]QXJ23031.1 AMP-binding protein [Actinomadura graeca]